MNVTSKMQRLGLLVAVVVLSGTAVAAAQTAPSKATPVPGVIGPISVTATFRPFMAAIDAQVPLNLPAYGYVEEEYFVSGAANVYDWARNGDVTVRTPNAPYTTRVLVRRPNDPKRFSGTVWVEFLNPARGYDLAEAWGYTNYYMLDHGDAYVGITTFPVTIKALKTFDAKRYASMSMANPAPLAQACKESGNTYSAEMEEGLKWDMVSQVGALLKSNLPGRPLAALKVEEVYLWAQTNGDLPTYINAFHKLANLESGKPVWDGYLLKDSGGPQRTHQCAERPGPGDPRKVIRNISAPVVFVLVENSTLGILESRRADSDEPGDRYRRYEIPGASHVDSSVFPWMPSLKILADMKSDVTTTLWPYTYECKPMVGLTDFPVHYYVSGAMANLDQWVRKGTPPPRVDRIQVSGSDTPNPAIVRDQYGNALGGLRSAYVEVPAATYHDKGTCSNTGYKEPFGWERLEAIYGSYKNYAAKFNAAVNRNVSDRLVPEAYAARMKAGLTAMPSTDQR